MSLECCAVARKLFTCAGSPNPLTCTGCAGEISSRKARVGPPHPLIHRGCHHFVLTHTPASVHMSSVVNCAAKRFRSPPLPPPPPATADLLVVPAPTIRPGAAAAPCAVAAPCAIAAIRCRRGWRQHERRRHRSAGVVGQRCRWRCKENHLKHLTLRLLRRAMQGPTAHPADSANEFCDERLLSVVFAEERARTDFILWAPDSSRGLGRCGGRGRSGTRAGRRRSSRKACQA